MCLVQGHRVRKRWNWDLNSDLPDGNYKSSLPAVPLVAVVWLLTLWVFLSHFARLVLCPISLSSSYYYNLPYSLSFPDPLSLSFPSLPILRTEPEEPLWKASQPIHTPSTHLKPSIPVLWFAEYRADSLRRPKDSPVQHLSAHLPKTVSKMLTLTPSIQPHPSPFSHSNFPCPFCHWAFAHDARKALPLPSA